MEKFVAILQLFAAVLLSIIATATAVNLLFIVNRPETISVVNTLIGQGVIIICLFALANILMRKGWKSLREHGQIKQSSE